MNITVTKERVLEAIEKNPNAKKILIDLFPFLNDFDVVSFDGDEIKINGFPAIYKMDGDDVRSLHLDSNFKWDISPSKTGLGYQLKYTKI